MFQPLRPFPSDESHIDREVKTAAERNEELAIMRVVELRWARRSAVAMAAFFVLLVVVLSLVFGVLPRNRAAAGTPTMLGEPITIPGMT